MSEKKLCYALVYTGSNKKILARTILFYELLSKLTKKQIFVITDSEENQKSLSTHIPFEKIYLPDNVERFYFSNDLFDGHSRYPNIFIKFAVYELKQFGFSHVIYIDTDVIINYNGLENNLSILEKEILFLKEKQIMCHKYSPAEDCCEERRFIASCMAFNIELNLIDELLSFNLPGKTEEWTLKNYDSKTFKVWELPDGLITNNSSTKRFTIFYHSASKLFYSVLKTTQPDNYERFKSLCYELENSNEDSLF